MSEEEKSDYKVGYRKPPKHTRFTKGRSGNPKGRPKKSRNIRTILNETLAKKVQVRENGKTKSVPLAEA